MALPGLRRLDHVGFTVPDLDEAQRFLVDVLGCEYLYSLGPFADEGDWMADHLNVHPRAVVTENRFFRLGGQAILEVFHYTAPGQRLTGPRNSDVGGHHVALYVDDLDAAVAHLRAARRHRARRADGEPRGARGAAVGLLPGTLGHAVRAGLVPARPPVVPRRGRPGGARLVTADTAGTRCRAASRPSRRRPRAAASPTTCARRSSAAPSAPVSGCARRTSPSSSAPAASRCARRCGCSRPRGSSSTRRTRARGCRG